MRHTASHYFELLLVIIAALLHQIHSLPTPVKPVLQPASAISKATAIQPVDLILSSGFCAFARQAGNIIYLSIAMKEEAEEVVERD